MHGASSTDRKIGASHEPGQQPNKADPPRTGVFARSIEAMQRGGLSAATPEHAMAEQTWLDFHGRLISSSLDPIAGFPNEQNEGGDHANHDKHPVLHLEAQNGEMLDQKLHCFPPPFWAG